MNFLHKLYVILIHITCRVSNVPLMVLGEATLTYLELLYFKTEASHTTPTHNLK